MAMPWRANHASSPASAWSTIVRAAESRASGPGPAASVAMTRTLGTLGWSWRNLPRSGASYGIDLGCGSRTPARQLEVGRAPAPKCQGEIRPDMTPAVRLETDVEAPIGEEQTRQTKLHPDVADGLSSSARPAICGEPWAGSLRRTRETEARRASRSTRRRGSSRPFRPRRRERAVPPRGDFRLVGDPTAAWIDHTRRDMYPGGRPSAERGRANAYPVRRSTPSVHAATMATCLPARERHAHARRPSRPSCDL